MGLAPRQMAPENATESPVWFKGVQGFGRAHYVDTADALLAGRLSVFSHQVEQTAGLPSWNRDPLTGTEAPLDFGKSIDYLDVCLVGNIKYLWEPNRHLELVTLAQAFALTGEDRYLEGVGLRLQSWLDQCPYPKGVNWASALEVGIRLINWSLTWQLVGGRSSTLFAGEQGNRLRERWLDSIFQHAHFVSHNYSRFSSANNHLLGEAAGVFIATCTWPYWNSFLGWGEKAKRILAREAETQTHADGVNREQAVAYQQFVMDFLILAGLAGRATGRGFPDDYWRTIERMMEFVQAILDVGGNVPMIGDADDGFVVHLSQEPGFCPYRSLLATGALLFDRPDFAASSGGLDDKTRFLLGGDGWVDLQARAGGPGGARRRSFPEGGYYLLGEGFDTESEVRLVADCGALGYLSIAAHGHADALAVWLSVAGREFLVDPGTYTYHGQPEWRAYFRGTRAHNTVTVDGQDQSVQGGSFMWLKHAEARCLRFEKGDEEDLFGGEHDGYRRLADPVTHRREIHRRGRVFEVTDTLVCKGGHAVERWWHFSEKCNVTVASHEIHAENQGSRIRLDPGIGQVHVYRGSGHPIAGWVSRRFDVKVPSTSICVRSDIRGTMALHTTIACFPG
jgi:hypothetical protein